MMMPAITIQQATAKSKKSMRHLRVRIIPPTGDIVPVNPLPLNDPQSQAFCCLIAEIISQSIATALKTDTIN